MNNFGRGLTFTLFLAFFVLVFAGCSGKSRIAEDGSKYSVTDEERKFNNKQEVNKRISDSYDQGVSAGYSKAKEEFARILPYIEAIRASAELKSSGGLCLPPLFLDKSSGSRVAIVLGEAHVCKNFTIDNVLEATKHGIPGLPKSKCESAGDSLSPGLGFVPSSISIAQRDKKDFFVEEVKAASEPTKVKTKDTYNSREILKETKLNYSNVVINDNKYLLIEFPSKDMADSFCRKYSICE